MKTASVYLLAVLSAAMLASSCDRGSSGGPSAQNAQNQAAQKPGGQAEKAATASGNPEQAVTKISGKTMGTFYQITIPGGYKEGEQALRTLAEKSFDKISAAISSFDPNSEIHRFNEFRSTEAYPVSLMLGRILQEARYFSLRTKGAMDISVAPLVNLWGFGKNHTGDRIPTDEEIAAAKALVGVDKYEIRIAKNGLVMLQKTEPKVELDLSTMGEGLGADAVASLLDRKGVMNYLVSVAGASRSRGLNPRGENWKIGIEDPTAPDHRIFATVCPRGRAMSTAGSYRNFFKDEKTGKFYSHIIDPSTGKPVEHNTVSVTVIADRALETDALDTGLLVWGAEKALAWAEEQDLAIFTIELENGMPVGRNSRAFRQYLDCELRNPGPMVLHIPPPGKKIN